MFTQLYLQKNTYTYSRKIELKEILKIQLSLEDKIHTLKTVLVSVATILLIVTFSPDSLDIVKGSPAKRRSFLDMMCSQISKSYLIKKRGISPLY